MNQNVTNGVARPHRFTNLWKSDPNLPLTQWLQLSWKEDKEVSTIELTFPGHLLREYHAYDPFYLDPQCPKDYSILVMINEQWETVVEVKGNYQRQRKHLLIKKVLTNKLRVCIHATNGDPSAQIYEVRCY